MMLHSLKFLNLDYSVYYAEFIFLSCMPCALYLLQRVLSVICASSCGDTDACTMFVRPRDKVDQTFSKSGTNYIVEGM